MNLRKTLKNGFLVLLASLVLTACATQKTTTGQLQSDVYTGSDSVEYLASGVADRVFFATNETVLTTASRET
jgi:peptidoglycan-associated lipoprotein